MPAQFSPPPVRDAAADDRIVVVHWVHRWLPQTETWLFNQVRHLPVSVESHVVCESTSNLDQFPWPNIHSVENAPRWRQIWDRRMRKLKLRRYFGFLVQAAKRNRAGVLHSHFGNAGWANLGAARRAGLKHLVTFYGFDVGSLPQGDRRWHKRYRDLFRQVDRVLCEGPHMGKCIVALGCPESKLCVHHLGVATKEIVFRPRTWSPSEPLRVLIAAAFREKKGIPYALEALGRFQDEVPLEITIVGDASDRLDGQAEKQKILAAIERCNLKSKTRMLGFQPYSVMFSEAYRHHLFISPSVVAASGDTEGGAPLAMVEMAATGMPIVSTRHCDIPEVILHGKTGFLTAERDVEGLVTGLRWWTQRVAEWPAILQAGRSHIDNEYDASRQGERLAGIYREL